MEKGTDHGKVRPDPRGSGRVATFENGRHPETSRDEIGEREPRLGNDNGGPLQIVQSNPSRGLAGFGLGLGFGLGSPCS